MLWPSSFLTLLLGDKYCGLAFNIVHLLKRTCLNLVCLCYTAAFLVQCLIQLCPVFHNLSSPLPVSSFLRDRSVLRVCTCVRSYMPTWWSACGMRTCHCACMCACTVCLFAWVWASLSIVACGFSCRGVDHDTAVNLKGKLINWSASDSSTSSPQNGLCSLTLERSATCSGEEGSDNSVMEHREGEKKKKRPPSLLPPPTLLPSLHLTDYECMSKEGRSDKKSQNRRKRPKSRTGVKYIHWLPQYDTQTLTDSYTGNRIVWFLKGIDTHVHKWYRSRRLAWKVHTVQTWEEAFLFCQTCKPTGRQK